MCVAFFPACRLRSRDVPRSIDSSTRSGNRSNSKLWHKMNYRTLSASSVAACLSDSIDARPSACSLLCDMSALTASQCCMLFAQCSRPVIYPASLSNTHRLVCCTQYTHQHFNSVFLSTEDPRSFVGTQTLEPDFVASCLASLADLPTDKQDQLLFIILVIQEAAASFIFGSLHAAVADSCSWVIPTALLHMCFQVVGYYPKRLPFVEYHL